MQSCHVLYGVKDAYDDPLWGTVPARRVILGVHRTWSGLQEALAKAIKNVDEYKDPVKRSLTFNWNFDYVDFETRVLED